MRTAARSTHYDDDEIFAILHSDRYDKHDEKRKKKMEAKNTKERRTKSRRKETEDWEREEQCAVIYVLILVVVSFSSICIGASSPWFVYYTHIYIYIYT